MKTRISPLTKSIRKYLNQGMAPKDIAKKLRVEVQKVYNVQYYMRKREAAKAKLDTGGIPTIKPQLETGISSWPHHPPKEITEVITITPSSPLPLEPKPTLWQRIKNLFVFPL